MDLTFSALTATHDNGSTWQPGSPLQPGLADVPDALAAAPSGGRMLALLLGGTLTQSGDDGTHWLALSDVRSLAQTAAGQRCSPAGLTAVSLTPAGAPLAAATCTRPGVTGIFSYTAGSWQAARPSLLAPLAGAATGVLRLTSTPTGNEALLVAGAGTAASLLAARTGDGGAHWALSAPVRPARQPSGLPASAPAARRGPCSATAAPRPSVARRQPGARCPPCRREPPHLPRPRRRLRRARGKRQQVDHLAAHQGATAWTRTQVINVPIEYGSSS